MPVFAQRQLGKRAAVTDLRIKSLRQRMNLSAAQATPDQVQWHARLPASGIPMLGNDRVGNCVWASACHYVMLVSQYTGLNIMPTTDEAVAAYSAGTGYIPGNAATDLGTVVRGPGGMIEYWTNHGIMMGGVLNKCGPSASVDWTNAAELQAAIDLFGAVFIGSNMTQDDVDSPYLWLNQTGPFIGGHEYILTGFERLADTTRYDVMTWNGMWRCDDVWLDHAADEALVIYNHDFFDARGISPGGIDVAALTADMATFA